MPSFFCLFCFIYSNFHDPLLIPQHILGQFTVALVDPLGETMTLQDSESADQSIIMTAYPMLIGIGVKPEFLNLSEDFAFTFTHVRSTNDYSPLDLIKVDKEGNILDTWVAEGSFSASAYYPK